jgi:hypothetical protein
MKLPLFVELKLPLFVEFNALDPEDSIYRFNLLFNGEEHFSAAIVHIRNDGLESYLVGRVSCIEGIEGSLEIIYKKNSVPDSIFLDRVRFGRRQGAGEVLGKDFSHTPFDVYYYPIYILC